MSVVGGNIIFRLYPPKKIAAEFRPAVTAKEFVSITKSLAAKKFNGFLKRTESLRT